MTSLDGIADLHMSGARAVFELERGARIGEKQLAAAFEEQGMALETFGELRLPRARGIYTVDSGIT